jgi:hypothetical protein
MDRIPMPWPFHGVARRDTKVIRHGWRSGKRVLGHGFCGTSDEVPHKEVRVNLAPFPILIKGFLPQVFHISWFSLALP